MVDSNVPKVSFHAVGNSLPKVFGLSSSKPGATKHAFGFNPFFISLFYQANPTN